MGAGVRTRSGSRPAPRTARELLQQKLDDRPETAKMQRVKMMTREEKARAGIDGMTRAHLESARAAGLNVSESEIRAEVQKVADRVELRKDIEGK